MRYQVGVYIRLGKKVQPDAGPRRGSSQVGGFGGVGDGVGLPVSGALAFTLGAAGVCRAGSLPLGLLLTFGGVGMVAGVSLKSVKPFLKNAAGYLAAAVVFRPVQAQSKADH